MAREGIFSDSKFLEIDELPRAAAPGLHHFARILDRGMKADKCLEWLRQVISSDSKFEKIAGLRGAATPGHHHLLDYWKEA